MRLVAPLRLIAALTLVLAVHALVAPVRAEAHTGRPDWPFGHSRIHAPRPMPVFHAPPPRRVWVPAGWVDQVERVWVPGYTERVWQEPAFSWRYDSCGKRVRVQFGTGAWRTIEHPGRWEERIVRVWQPGYWTVAHGC